MKSIKVIDNKKQIIKDIVKFFKKYKNEDRKYSLLLDEFKKMLIEHIKKDELNNIDIV